jgi:hypothetical protein
LPPELQPLRYHSGAVIEVGGRIETIANGVGTVVHVVGCARPMPGFANAAWADLERGFLVRGRDGVLTHYKMALPTMHLVARRAPEANASR